MRTNTIGGIGGAVVAVLLAAGCENAPSQAEVRPGTDAEFAARAGPNVVNVTARHQEFVTSAREIGSGWTTLRLKNRSHAPHFLILEQMPEFEGEQKTVEDSREEVVPVFQNFMDLFREEPLSFPEAGFDLPDWYGDVEFVGGVGLVSPGETGQVTLNLEPGTYVIECYVKTSDGTFHSANGMIEGLTVTQASNAAGAPPRSSLRLTVSSRDGITGDGEISSPGIHTIEVRFEDQSVYSHLLGHDVHLVRLDEGADLGELATWMNWMVPGSLASPAPAGVRFLGGTQDMPGGSTTYVTAKLKRGDYAWIAEVPDPAGKDMLVEFSVP